LTFFKRFTIIIDIFTTIKENDSISLTSYKYIMKKFILLSILTISFTGFTQVFQEQAPWIQNQQFKNKSTITLEEISKSAGNYFKTIDKNKKGSGLKPFERWRYHWSFYTKNDGTIAPAKDLWKAWKEKNNMNKNSARTDISNWASIGPYSHTNTASWSPGQGRVNVIALDPSDSNTYYVGAPAGGIWKSTDAGINWSPLVDYLPQIGVSGIAVHPTDSKIIYIATGDDDANDSYSVGVWKSTDGGATWNNTGALTGNPNSMNDIYIDSNNPNTVLVATSSGVFKTIDGGTSWVRKLSGNIRDLKMKPEDSSVFYAATSNTFYKSTDSGETFTAVSIPSLTNSSRIVIDVTPANNGYVYLVSANNNNAFNGIFKSTDSGTTFTKTSETTDIFESTQSWYDLALTVSDTQPNTIYVGVLNIWKSTNGGDNFTKMNSWNSPNATSYTHADIHFMRFIDGKFFAGTDGGIYRSTDHGTNFINLTKNLAISQFYKISVASQNSGNIVGGLQDNGGYAYHNNNWSNYFGADGMDCAVSTTSPNTYYGFIQNGGSLYRTDDGGITRSSAVDKPTGETGKWVTPLVSNASGDLYAGYTQLYKLIAGAWKKVSNHSFGGALVNIEINPNNNDNIYVSRGGNLYRSTNFTAGNFIFQNIPFSHGTINSIEVHNDDSNILWVATNNGIYKSTNILSTSPTFTNISNNLPSESKLVVRHHLRSGNNTIYVGTTLGVYFLNDDSTNWEAFDNNLPNVAVRDLEINENDSKLYAATYGRGVFMSNIPVILPADDIYLTSIQEPNNGFTCKDEVSPKIIVKNQGTNVINEITINYTLDGGANNVFIWNGALNSEQTTTITIPTLTSLSLGSHSLSFETTITNDAYSSNNNSTTTFSVNNSSTTPTTLNTFENASQELLTETTGSDLWEIAIPNKTLLNTASSGNKAYVTTATGNYPDNTIGYLYTNCYDLSSITSPILAFKMGFDIEQDWDYLLMEYSIDKGITWTTLGTATDSNWYNSSSTANGIPGNQWTGEGEDVNSLGGTNATLHDYSYDLAALTNEVNIVFRFVFKSDSGVNEEGVVIDDLVVNGTLSLNDTLLQNAISIYPNPSEDIFNISWKFNNKASIDVYNYLGQLILQHKNVENNYSLNMKGYSKGFYFIKILINNRQATKKIMLK